jgi:hypothetical protein
LKPLFGLLKCLSQVALEWHPSRPLVATASTNGRIYLWAKSYKENWSAFAPEFKVQQPPSQPRGSRCRRRPLGRVPAGQRGLNESSGAASYHLRSVPSPSAQVP